MTPETDDTLLRLLQMLDESGVKCTLKLCTRRYRLLKERGRTDILRLLGNHELAFHTSTSIHPLPTEYLDRMGFKGGCRGLSTGMNTPDLKRLKNSQRTKPDLLRPSGLWRWAAQVFSGPEKGNGACRLIWTCMISFGWTDNPFGMAVCCAIRR